MKNSPGKIHPLQELLLRLSCAKHRFLYQTTALGRVNQARLAELKGSRAGQRCFILGNGPSLRHTDLSRLRGEFTFGLNRIYLLFKELGFPTTYLVTVNWLVLEQCYREILALPTTKFIPWNFRSYCTDLMDRETLFIQSMCPRPVFSGQIQKPFWTGPTVTFAAMQIAFFLGFEQVVLVGVDHSFTTSGPANQEVVSTGSDPNHFSPDYFGKGFRWQLPDLEASEYAYRLARSAYEADGRRIVDATVGGKLTVFPKVEYSSLFR